MRFSLPCAPAALMARMKSILVVAAQMRVHAENS
jgi:hypothetical protein